MARAGPHAKRADQVSRSHVTPEAVLSVRVSRPVVSAPKVFENNVYFYANRKSIGFGGLRDSLTVASSSDNCR